jgi:hypothetical protein
MAEAGDSTAAGMMGENGAGCTPVDKYEKKQLFWFY